MAAKGDLLLSFQHAEGAELTAELKERSFQGGGKGMSLCWKGAHLPNGKVYDVNVMLVERGES